jgi:hypothetical protein
MEEILETIANEYSEFEIVRLDGLDEAILGLGTSYCNTQPLLVYSRDKIIEIFMRDMPEEQAVEHFDFNVGCLYAGPGTPMIVQ